MQDLKTYHFEMPIGDNGEKFTMSINPQALPKEMQERILFVDELDKGFIVTTTLDRKFYIQYFEVEEIFPNGFDKDKLLGKTLDCLLGEQYE